MFRVLSILAAVASLAVAAAPVASAGSSNQPTPRTLGAGKDRGWVKARGAGVIESLGVKYTASAPKPPRAVGARSRSVSNWRNPAQPLDHGILIDLDASVT